MKRDPWREAVIDELVVAHIYNEAHEADPKKAIADAIAWNVMVALDPRVSEDARKLRDTYLVDDIQDASNLNPFCITAIILTALALWAVQLFILAEALL